MLSVQKIRTAPRTRKQRPPGRARRATGWRLSLAVHRVIDL